MGGGSGVGQPSKTVTVKKNRPRLHQPKTNNNKRREKNKKSHTHQVMHANKSVLFMLDQHLHINSPSSLLKETEEAWSTHSAQTVAMILNE